MCPRPQAGSRHVIEPNRSLLAITCSMSALVAQGGVGKSSRLFFSSALCAMTAWEVFCIGLTCGCCLRVCSPFVPDSAEFDNGLIRPGWVLLRGSGTTGFSPLYSAFYVAA